MSDYDLHQKSAPLLMCLGCGKSFFVTVPEGWIRCVGCSR